MPQLPQSRVSHQNFWASSGCGRKGSAKRRAQADLLPSSLPDLRLQPLGARNVLQEMLGNAVSQPTFDEVAAGGLQGA